MVFVLKTHPDRLDYITLTHCFQFPHSLLTGSHLFACSTCTMCNPWGDKVRLLIIKPYKLRSSLSLPGVVPVGCRMEIGQGMALACFERHRTARQLSVAHTLLLWQATGNGTFILGRACVEAISTASSRRGVPRMQKLKSVCWEILNYFGNLFSFACFNWPHRQLGNLRL